MGSRIVPAMSDARAFTNYVSSGLYNNYLEDKFNTVDDSAYRMYLQKNTKNVEKVINSLTAYYVQPPKMPKVALKVAGGSDEHGVPGIYGQPDKVLNASYYKTLNQFNKKVRG